MGRGGGEHEGGESSDRNRARVRGRDRRGDRTPTARPRTGRYAPTCGSTPRPIRTWTRRRRTADARRRASRRRAREDECLWRGAHSAVELGIQIVSRIGPTNRPRLESRANLRIFKIRAAGGRSWLQSLGIVPSAVTPAGASGRTEATPSHRARRCPFPARSASRSARMPVRSLPTLGSTRAPPASFVGAISGVCTHPSIRSLVPAPR